MVHELSSDRFLALIIVSDMWYVFHLVEQKLSPFTKLLGNGLIWEQSF